MPVLKSSGIAITVMAGEYAQKKSPIELPHPVLFLEIELEATSNKETQISLHAGWNTIIYNLESSSTFPSIFECQPS